MKRPGVSCKNEKSPAKCGILSCRKIFLVGKYVNWVPEVANTIILSCGIFTGPASRIILLVQYYDYMQRQHSIVAIVYIVNFSIIDIVLHLCQLMGEGNDFSAV